MKKILFLFLLLLVPVSVFAADYKVSDVLIDAEVMENGDMKVKELIVLNGIFNGYIRDISYGNKKLTYHTPIDFSSDALYNATGISGVSVSAKALTKTVNFESMKEEFEPLTIAYYDYNAENKNYVKSYLSSGESYKMYYKSDGESVGFLLEYTLNDVVVMHEDIAEIYWTFIGEGFDDKIANVQIRVTLPKESEDMLVWAHGDLTGDIERVNNSSVLATIRKLPANSPVDIRMTFSKEIMNFSITKQSNVEALEDILEIEEQRALEANRQRENAKKVVFLCTVSGVIYLVTLIFSWIRVYLKYDKEYPPEFQLEYHREFIDDYNVEVVEYLMKNVIDESAFSASILNLIYKKNIKFEELPNEKKKKKIYQFTLLNREHLNDTENCLVDFLFLNVGKDDKFTTKDLERYASSSKTYTNFQASFTKWKNSVLKDAKNENFYEDKKEQIGVGFFFFILGLLLMFISHNMGTDLILPWVCGGFGVIFLFYCIFLRKKTKRGMEHYTKWKAFKKFLEDFGNFDTKELPEIVLWERYLVYATVFGIADKVQKSMNVKINELHLNATSYSYYPTWIDYNLATSIHRSVHSSFQANQQTYTRQTASSSHSSGSGFGGGFSSGGGFGGGGGGGRGF